MEIYEKIIGLEIWEDIDGEVDVFIVGVGIGGILIGVSCYIKKIKGKFIIMVVVELIDFFVII